MEGTLPTVNIGVSLLDASSSLAHLTFPSFQVDYEAELTEIKEFLQHYVKPARGDARHDLPRDDDAQAEEDAESNDEEDLADGLGGMDMDEDEEARARRPKAKYMKMFVSRCVATSWMALTDDGLSDQGRQQAVAGREDRSGGSAKGGYHSRCRQLLSKRSYLARSHIAPPTPHLEKHQTIHHPLRASH